MMNFIIESSISLLVFYGIYWVLLRNGKFFLFNRYFLISVIIFSLLVPFLNIPVVLSQAGNNDLNLLNIENKIQGTIFYQEYLAGNTASDAVSDSVNKSALSISFTLLIFYLTGLTFFLIRFIMSLTRIFKTVKCSETIKGDGYRIILTDDDPGPHSFFRYIFLNRKAYKEGRTDSIMLNHELEHVRHLHSVDIMMIEVIKIIYWFNPLFLLYDRAIRINHEYLADNNVVGSNCTMNSYVDRLLSFITVKNIPLTSGSSNSFTKMRLLMLTRNVPGTGIRWLRIVSALSLSIIVLFLLGFKAARETSSSASVNMIAAKNEQDIVKGIVLKEDGNPLMLVTVVTNTGTGVQTGPDGKFYISGVNNNTILQFSCIGYKNQSVRAVFGSEMTVRMVTDPEYKSTVMTLNNTFVHEGPYVTVSITDDNQLQSLIIIDGKETDYKGKVKLKREEFAFVKVLKGKEATDKYGEKGRYGVMEITTRKRAEELGIKRLELKASPMYPEDFPTFQGKDSESFTSWILTNLKYPDEARKNRIEGRVRVSFSIEADGTVSKVSCPGMSSPILNEAVIKVIQSSPKWEPAKNPDFRKPVSKQVYLKFTLPNDVSKDDAVTVADVMPSYPGGDDALMKFINSNIRYPGEAKALNKEGRVILGFVINREGATEDIMVLKGVDPLLDAEAQRVVSLIKGFEPGMIRGKPVPVYFNLVVPFSLE